MKKFLIAASMAIAASSFSYGAAQAQSVVITDGDTPDYYHHHHYNNDDGDRRDDGYADRQDDHGWHRGWDKRHFQHARCMTKMETIQHHGHTVTRETRFCK
jgi:hypothetical protein